MYQVEFERTLFGNLYNEYRRKDLPDNVTDLVAIKKAELLIRSHGRMLVRKSGTEPKIRIMAEANNKKLINKCIKIVQRTIT